MNKKFDEMIDSLRNGNISDFNVAVKKLSKKNLLKLITYTVAETAMDFHYIVGRLQLVFK